MSQATLSALYALVLFAGVLIFDFLGIALGRYQAKKLAGNAQAGTGSVETAALGLLGLLMAFTFSGSFSKLETKRHLIAEEATAIGTAYLRLDMLPEDSRDQLRGLFRQYLQLRLTSYDQIMGTTRSVPPEAGGVTGGNLVQGPEGRHAAEPGDFHPGAAGDQPDD